MSIEEKIKKLLEGSEEEIKDASDETDSKDGGEADDLKEDKKGDLIKKIQKALDQYGDKKIPTINGVKGLSKADLEIALDCLERGSLGNCSSEVKQLLGDLVEESSEDDDEDDKNNDGKDDSDSKDDEDDDLKEAVTKKDLVPIAAIVKAVPDQKTRQQLANKLANLFAGGNPAFSGAIWHKACGTSENADESFIPDVSIRDVKEDIDALVNGENLSEEFKAKATTIFESAVLVRVKKEVSRITEELEEKNENALREQKEQLIDLIDGYLGTIAEQWLSDNEIALESSLKTEMYDNFITKMKTVFVESYIEVPEEKFDILEDKENQIKQISEQLNKATSTLIDSRKVINQLEREKVVSEATSKMSSTDKERLIELTENLEFDVTNKEDFISKVETIKESYFGNGVKKPQTSQKFISDTKVLTEDKKSTTVHPDVAMYL